jgi:nitroimidazol reductase NimA-like FMN-containing flavoprotein (pyridoxamine 5'-phosphate oxidase superfamily)
MPPDYGIPTSKEGMLEWGHVRERMEEARNFWVGTVDADGRPHATPVWGVWLDGALYFDGSPETRRGRNIAANPAVVVHLENGEDVVIIEGEAHEASPPERALAVRISAGYRAKYDSDGYKPESDQWDAGGLYRMQPHVVFAWTKFPEDATRWSFGGE